MKVITRLCLVAVTAAASAAVALPADANTAPSRHAVFVQSDDPAGNHIVVYDRGADGALTPAGSYATGGLGGILAGSVVDHLASQGSLTYDEQHGLLYAVNAGSNTVSVFAVDGDRLRLRQVVTSGGTFPVSVAVRGNLVYVVNAEQGGSIQGYVVFDGRLLPIRAFHRTLGLDPAATPQFVNTPGQVGFSADGRHLVVTTKANGNDIDVFALDRFGVPSATPTVNAEPGAVPFAFVDDAAGHLVVADAGTNAVVTYTVNGDGTLTQLGSAATGQAATCWIAGARGSFYVSNAGSASLSGYRTDAAGALTALGNTTTDAGTIDAAASPDGGYLYVRAGAAGILDSYQVAADGSLTRIGTLTVPDSAGGEGIATS